MSQAPTQFWQNDPVVAPTDDGADWWKSDPVVGQTPKPQQGFIDETGRNIGAPNAVPASWLDPTNQFGIKGAANAAPGLPPWFAPPPEAAGLAQDEQGNWMQRGPNGLVPYQGPMVNERGTVPALNAEDVPVIGSAQALIRSITETPNEALYRQYNQPMTKGIGGFATGAARLAKNIVSPGDMTVGAGATGLEETRDPIMAMGYAAITQAFNTIGLQGADKVSQAVVRAIGDKISKGLVGRGVTAISSELAGGATDAAIRIEGQALGELLLRSTHQASQDAQNGSDPGEAINARFSEALGEFLKNQPEMLATAAVAGGVSRVPRIAGAAIAGAKEARANRPVEAPSPGVKRVGNLAEQEPPDAQGQTGGVRPVLPTGPAPAGGAAAEAVGGAAQPVPGGRSAPEVQAGGPAAGQPGQTADAYGSLKRPELIKSVRARFPGFDQRFADLSDDQLRQVLRDADIVQPTTAPTGAQPQEQTHEGNQGRQETQGRQEDQALLSPRPAEGSAPQGAPAVAGSVPPAEAPKPEVRQPGVGQGERPAVAGEPDHLAALSDRDLVALAQEHGVDPSMDRGDVIAALRGKAVGLAQPVPPVNQGALAAGGKDVAPAVAPGVGLQGGAADEIGQPESQKPKPEAGAVVPGAPEGTPRRGSGGKVVVVGEGAAQGKPPAPDTTPPELEATQKQIRDAFVARGPEHERVSRQIDDMVKDRTLSQNGAALVRAVLHDINPETLGRINLRAGEPGKKSVGVAFDADTGKPPTRKTENAVAMIRQGLAEELAKLQAKGRHKDIDVQAAAATIEEVNHILARVVPSENDQKNLRREYNSKTPEQWSLEFQADGLGKAAADYAAGVNPETPGKATPTGFDEWVARKLFMHQMGHASKNPVHRAIMERVFAAFKRALQRFAEALGFIPDKLKPIFEAMRMGEVRPDEGTAAKPRRKAPPRPPEPTLTERPAEAADKPQTSRTEAPKPQEGPVVEAPAPKIEQRPELPTERPKAAQTKSERPKPPQMSGTVQGKPGVVHLADKSELPITYTLVEADSLTPSHDARSGFDQNEAATINERNYHVAEQAQASRSQVQQIANFPKPALIYTDSPTATDGPPIVDSMGRVLGGNARTMGIQLAYYMGGTSADAYRRGAIEAATKFGLDPEAVARFKEPVIVRALSAADTEHLLGSDADEVRISAALNESLTAGKTAATEAVSKAARLSPASVNAIIGELADYDTLSDALANKGVQARILRAMAESGAWGAKERESLLDDGELNKQGRTALEDALLGTVIKDVKALSALPDGVRGMMVKSVPAMLGIRESMDRPDSDVKFDRLFADAVKAMDLARGAGESARVLATESLNRDALDPVLRDPRAVALADAMMKGAREPRKFAERMKAVAASIREAANGQVDMMTGRALSPGEAFDLEMGVKALHGRTLEDQSMRDRFAAEIKERRKELEARREIVRAKLGPDGGQIPYRNGNQIAVISKNPDLASRDKYPWRVTIFGQLRDGKRVPFSHTVHKSLDTPGQSYIDSSAVDEVAKFGDIGGTHALYGRSLFDSEEEDPADRRMMLEVHQVEGEGGRTRWQLYDPEKNMLVGLKFLTLESAKGARNQANELRREEMQRKADERKKRNNALPSIESYIDAPQQPWETAEDYRLRQKWKDAARNTGTLFGRSLTETEERDDFKGWFGDSKIVDGSGRPLVVFHGTPTPGFEAFDPNKAKPGLWGKGFYFTDDPAMAGGSEIVNDNRPFSPDIFTGYAKTGSQAIGESPAMLPVYLSIQNPLDMRDYRTLRNFARELLRSGVALSPVERASLGDMLDREQSPERQMFNQGPATFMRRTLGGGNGLLSKARALGHDGLISRDKNQHVGPHNVYVAFKPDQIKSVFAQSFTPGDARMLHGRELDKVNQDELGFTSRLEGWVNEKLRGPLPAGQIRLSLKNAGLPADEIKWTGIDDWLESKKGEKVTPDQVREYLSQNRVELKEKVLGGSSADQRVANAVRRHDAAEQKMRRIVNKIDSRDAAFENFEDAARYYDRDGQGLSSLSDEEAFQQAIRPYGVDVQEKLRRIGAFEAFKELREARKERSIAQSLRGPSNNTRYSQFTLPGGENYREVLLTLPPVPPTYKPKHPEVWTKTREGLNLSSRGGSRGEYDRWTHPKGHKITHIPERTEGPFVLDGSGPPYISNAGHPSLEAAMHSAESGQVPYHDDLRGIKFQSSHFSEPNIIAHLRLKDRTTPDGKRVLFAEEIQSDWHEQGRDRGYSDVEQRRRLRADAQVAEDERKRLVAERVKWMDATFTGPYGYDPKTATPEQRAEYERRVEQEDSLAERASALHRQADREGERAVPPAPFSKTWHEMAFRRLLRLAAEGGYDAVGWTTAETQVDRYEGLVEEVTDIGWDSERSELLAVRASDGEGNRYTHVASNVTEKNLADYVGKDVAKELLRQKEMNEATSGTPVTFHEYHGPMTIGGEGMRNFYDRDLVNYARKYGKKWGAEPTVGTVYTDAGENGSEEAPARLLPITPEMRDSVMKGQPLFGRKLSDEDESHPLVALHNTSVDGLKAALRMGGIPGPSIAILKHGDPFENYGRVTLIGRRSMIDPEADRRNKVFPADAYSPNQPPEYHVIDRKGMRALQDRIVADAPFVELGSGHWSTFEDDVNRGNKSQVGGLAAAAQWLEKELATKVMYLRELGEKVPIPQVSPVAKDSAARDPRVREWVEKYVKETDDLHPHGDAMLPLQKLLGVVGAEKINAALGRDEKITPDQAEPHWANVRRVFGDVLALVDNKRVPNVEAVERNVKRLIKKHGGQDALRAWANKLAATGFTGERVLRQGRRTEPYTLDNVTDAMFSGGTQATEQNMVYGLGQARAAGMRPVTHLTELHNRAGSLASREAVNERKESNNKALFALVEELRPYHSSGSAFSFDPLDDASKAIGEVIRGRSASAALSRNGYRNVPAHLADQTKEVAELVRETPTEYFEAKPNRGVRMSEFAAAVIPKDAPADLDTELKSHGVEAVRYNPNRKDARRRAVEHTAARYAEDDRGPNSALFGRSLFDQGPDDERAPEEPVPFSLFEKPKTPAAIPPTSDASDRPAAPRSTKAEALPAVSSEAQSESPSAQVQPAGDAVRPSPDSTALEQTNAFIDKMKAKKPMRMDGTTRPEKPAVAPRPLLPQKSVDLFNKAIEELDADSLAQMVYPTNKNWREMFEAKTGMKLPKTVGGSEAAAREWVRGQRAALPTDATVRDSATEKPAPQPETPVSEPSRRNDATAEPAPDTHAKATEFLRKLGIEVNSKTLPGGKVVYAVTGKTYAHRDTIKSVPGNKPTWYKKDQSWSFWQGDPTEGLAAALAGARVGGAGSKPATGRTDGEDLAIKEQRERELSRPDERGVGGDPAGAVERSTADLIRLGAKFGMPAEVLDSQIEDIGMVRKAFEGGKSLFVIGSAPGSGKTYVIGGSIRELRAAGAKKFIWVTMNDGLVDQIKNDLSQYGLGDVDFRTYADLSGAGSKEPTDATDAVLVFDECQNIKNETLRGAAGSKMIKQAKFTIFSSATPFENPVQAKYLEPTGVFAGVGGHTQWAILFGAQSVEIDGPNGQKVTIPRWVQTKEASELAKGAKRWFEKQGILSQRGLKLPPGMVKAHFEKYTASPENVALYEKVMGAYADAESDWKDGEGKPLDPKTYSLIAMHSQNAAKRILEAAKTASVVKRAKELTAEGKKVVIFVETKADRALGRFRKSKDTKGTRYSYPEIQDIMAQWKLENAGLSWQDREPPPFHQAIVSIAKHMHDAGLTDAELPSVTDDIQRALPKAYVFTGAMSDAQNKENLARWRADKTGILLATMAKGGTGLSLHDKKGDHPTAMLVLNMPWTATQLEQVSGRINRYGLASIAENYLLFADNIPFERKLAGRIGGRMRAMNATVKGIGSAAGDALTDFDFETNYSAKHMLLSDEQKAHEGESGASDRDIDIFDRAGAMEKARNQSPDKAMDYFPTPYTLAALMADAAGVKAGDKVLEPSAGEGNLLRFLPKGVHATILEPHSQRRAMAKGVGEQAELNVTDHPENFEDFTPSDAGPTRYTPMYRPPGFAQVPDGYTIIERPGNGTGGFERRTDLPISKHPFGVIEYPKPLPKEKVESFQLKQLSGGGVYDAVVMNPPFSRVAGKGWQDIAHVLRAFGMLKPDGRLVAIVSEGPFFREDLQSKGFREWLDEHGATVIRLPEGAFKDSGTGVRARMIVVDKQGGAGQDLDLNSIDPDDVRTMAKSVPTRPSALGDDAKELHGRAFHGSPHTFDKFDISKIGTGEGAQAYGHGLYFASNKEVAEHYRTSLAPWLYDGRPFDKSNPEHLAAEALDKNSSVRYQAKQDLAYKSKYGVQDDRLISEAIKALDEHREAKMTHGSAAQTVLIDGKDVFSGRRYDALTSKEKQGINEIYARQSYLRPEGAIERITRDLRTSIPNLERAIEKNQPISGDLSMDRHRLEDARAALALLETGRVSIRPEVKAAGHTYQVNLKPAEDEYLLWDKPISEQSAKVKRALKASGAWDGQREFDTNQDSGAYTGASLYRHLASTRGPTIPAGGGWPSMATASESAASAYLKSLGIRGIKYLDGSSRNKRASFEFASPEAQDRARELFESEPLGRGKQWADVTLDNNDGDLAKTRAELVDRDRRGHGDGGPAIALRLIDDGLIRPNEVNYNYVIFDDSDVEIEALHGRKLDDQTETPEFKRWFGDSKVVDENGKPLVVYHGTDRGFDSFSIKKFGQRDDGWFGKGFYFTPDADLASRYAESIHPEDSAGANVIPAYLSLQNPYVWPSGRTVPYNRDTREALQRELAAGGYDGVIVPIHDEPGSVHEVVAFHPEQIKSAIGNRGTFDPKDPNMLHGRSLSDDDEEELKRPGSPSGALAKIDQVLLTPPPAKLRAAMNTLSGYSAPKTAALSEDAANAVVGFATARTAATRRADWYKALVLGPSENDEKMRRIIGEVGNELTLQATRDRLLEKIAETLDPEEKSALQAKYDETTLTLIGHPDSVLKTQADYEKAKADPRVRDALHQWIKHAQPYLNARYQLIQEDPEAEVPYPSKDKDFEGFFWSLYAPTEGERAEMQDVRGPAQTTGSSPEAFRKRRAEKAQVRSASGKWYEPDAGKLIENSIAGRDYLEAAKRRMYAALNKAGLGVQADAGHDFKAPDGSKSKVPYFDGKPGRRLPEVVRKGRLPKFGGQSLTETKYQWVDPRVYNEVLAAGLKSNELQGHLAATIDHMLTATQVYGLTDLLSHTANIWRALAMAADVTHGSKGLRGLRATQVGAYVEAGTRLVRALARRWNNNADLRKQIMDLAEVGAMRPAAHRGHLPAWVENLLSGHPKTLGAARIIAGEWQSKFLRLIDEAGRVALDGLYDDVVRSGWIKDTPLNRREFNNMVGQYEGRLMGPVKRFARDLGAAPFVVAGINFNRNSVRALVGTSPLRAEGSGPPEIPGRRRVANDAEAGPGRARREMALWLGRLVGGLVAGALLAMLANWLISKRPFGRPGVPLGAIDLGYDHSDGTHATLDLFLLRGIRRGLRITGGKAIEEGVRNHRPVGQVLSDAQMDILAGLVHPWAGPAVTAAAVAATGRDVLGRQVAPVAPPGGSQGAENVKAALGQLNPMIHSFQEGMSAGGVGEGVKRALVRPLEGLAGIGHAREPNDKGRAGAEYHEWVDDLASRAGRIPRDKRAQFISDELKKAEPKDAARARQELFLRRKIMMKP